jgi:hypothetical protein
MDQPSLAAELADIAAWAGPVEQRAQALLEPLHRAVPYDAAWIAIRDPETHEHRAVALDGDTDALLDYFALPEADDEVEALGLNRFGPPVRAGDLPVPLQETMAWGDFLLPAGFRDGFAMALYSPDGRLLGFISLLSEAPARWMSTFGAELARLRPVLASGLDRLPALAAVAEIAGDVLAGVVVTRGGRCMAVPGLPGHLLLTPGSAVLSVARRQAAAPGASSTFLCPWPGGFARVRAIDCRDGAFDHLTTLVLMHPVDDLAGLTAGDLRLLGALMAGPDADWVQFRRGEAGLPERTAVLADRMGLRSTDELLLHVAREGLYVPPALWA